MCMVRRVDFRSVRSSDYNARFMELESTYMSATEDIRCWLTVISWTEVYFEKRTTNTKKYGKILMLNGLLQGPLATMAPLVSPECCKSAMREARYRQVNLSLLSCLRKFEPCTGFKADAHGQSMPHNPRRHRDLDIMLWETVCPVQYFFDSVGGVFNRDTSTTNL